MEPQRVVICIILGYATLGAAAQSGGNGTAANSASLAGAVSALAALFGGVSSSVSSSYAAANSTTPSLSASASPAPSPGSTYTRMAAQRGSRPFTDYQSNTQGKISALGEAICDLKNASQRNECFCISLKA